MALTTQEIELVRKMKSEGKTSKEIGGYIGGLRLGNNPINDVPKESLLSDTIGDIKQTGKSLLTTTKETFGQGGTVSKALEPVVEDKQGLLRSFAQAFGAGASGVAKGFGDIFTGTVKTALPPETENIVKENIKKTAVPVVKSVMEIPAVNKFINDYASLPEDQKRDVDALFGIGSLASELATSGFGSPIKKVSQNVLKTGIKGVTDTGEMVTDISKNIIKQTPRLTEKFLAKEPTLVEATGQILQGQTKDITKGVKGLAEVNKTGVKTYGDLKTKISDKITELSQKVDEDLDKDLTKYTLKDLTLTGKTKLGKTVKTDYITNALNQLKELYTTIGDKVKSTDIKDLLTQAKTGGLTRREVNDISRIYGQEFGEKAFSKIGEPLTSVNAQMFENVRTGLKNIARQGIGGKEAQLADRTISNLYNTEKLINKNIEAVNKLRQRIQERGILEKAGNLISKYADILTGGSIRGLVGGLLPRGAGYKVMNALDLEERLSKNLKVIEQATKGKTAKEIEDILKTLTQ